MAAKGRGEEEQKMLEEFLRLKPTRAIDRLLSEHSLDKVYLLYNTLQQKIRKNTSELRVTLTDKYEHLVDCSNLLTTIQQFTAQIQTIAVNINATFQQQERVQQLSSGQAATKPIKRVEQCIHLKKYGEAMRLIQSCSESQSGLSENQRLYLPYLKVQILQALERELITRKIDEQFVAEVIGCLKVYLQSLRESERDELASNSFEEDGLLQLIAEHISQKSFGVASSEAEILEMVFKCKLFSLSRLGRDSRQGEQISKFFMDVYRLITEQDRHAGVLVAGRAGANLLAARHGGSMLAARHPVGMVQPGQQLASIFCANLRQIEAHLSGTFIVGSADQIISFRYDLYEELLGSEEFIGSLDALHLMMVKNCEDAPRTSLKQSFVGLWSNYYHQLLEILFRKCSPVFQLPSCSLVGCDLPVELGKYSVADEKSVVEHLAAYRTQLQLFFTNVDELVSKSQSLNSRVIDSKSALEDIIGVYVKKIGEMNEKVGEAVQQMGNSPNEFNLHSTILLFFLCEEFNCYLLDTTTFSNLAQIKGYCITWNYSIVQKYGSIFQLGKTKNWYTNFDNFFMRYSPFISSPKLPILKQVILILLQAKMRVLEPELSKSLIEQCRRKKEKQQRQRQQKQSRIRDLKVSAIGPSTFAKKKNAPVG